MHIEPLTPKIARLVRARRGAILALTALACAALLSACGSSASSTSPPSSARLNTNQTKVAIENTIFVNRHIHAKVTCPATVAQATGVSFVCIATTPKGVTTSFQVTEKSNNGYVEYKAQ
jgi:hypothetical protein